MAIIQGTSKAAGAGYNIGRSIRFNFSDAAHLLRTPSSASNRRTWTWSLWVKRSGLGNPGGPNQVHMLFGVGSGSCLRFTSSDQLRLETPAGNHTFVTSQVFRDTSAWYHIVLAFDSTQATDTDRRKLYVNGSQVTDFSSTTFTGLAQNAEWDINSTSQHQIAKSNIADYFGGYLAELNFVDGTALDATSFGEYNDDGVWIPKAYDGSYGTNGFYITGATDSDLGEDFSGNNNDFTSSGLATTDQMLDTPTLNFCTLNPLITPATMTLTDGNLALSGYTAVTSAYGTFGMLSGKWYWELVAQTNAMAGIAATPNGSQYPGQAADSYSFDLTNGTKYNNGSSSAFGAGSVSAGDTVGVAFDADNGDLKFYNNSGTLIGTAFTGLTSGPYFPVFRNGSAANISINFGQQTFSHSLPASHVALNTANLATPSITDGSAHFQPTIYTGNGSTLEVNQSGNSTFQPDWVWGKRRNGAESHALFDAVRGTTKIIYSNLTNAETTNSGLTAFDADGFTIGSSATLNTNTGTYVAWQWKANGSGSSNEDGSINTTATSANTTAGFSVSTFTGTGANATVGHGLGIAPSLVIIKSRNDTHDWYVRTPALSGTEFLVLNTTAAKGTASPEVWNSTVPTSSVVNIGTSIGVNRNTYNYVMYCFAEIPGYSSIGSYTGNGSTDGPMVNVGFTPAFIMYKVTSTTDSWEMYDTTRQTSNVYGTQLKANLSNAETDDTRIDILSNGFKARSTNTAVNGSGASYIYMAFAENPFGGDGAAPATAR